jgi:APA family basic amino acid/polyamine antiporter
MGVAFGVAVAVGNALGAGILRAPGEIAARIPSVALYLVLWVIGACYAMLGAVSLAELGAMLQRSGGQYVFARDAFGPFGGFVSGWSDWISTCGSLAIVSIVVGEYVPAFVPALEGHETAIAASLVAGLALLQWRGVRWGSTTQEITSLAKTIAFAALIGACLILGAHGTPIRQTPPSTGITVAGVLLAMQGVIYTYDGWGAVTYFGEEIRDAGRQIPRAIFGSVLLLGAIYLLANVAYVRVVPYASMKGDPFVAGTAARAVFGPRGDALIRGVMIVSLVSSANALQLMASRVLFAMSRDGLFNARGARVNEGGTPSVALGAGTALTLALVLTGTFQKAAAMTSFCFVLDYALSFAALFVLRRRAPDRARPYRAWGYPWTTGIALVGSLAFLVAAIAADTLNSAIVLTALTVGYVLTARRGGGRTA